MQNVYIDGVKATKEMLEELSHAVKYGLVYIVDIKFADNATYMQTEEV